VKVNNNGLGIYVENDSFHTQIINGTEIFWNTTDAIYLRNTTGNNISNVNIHNNGWVWIYVSSWYNTTIDSVQITNSAGISLYSTNNNTITNISQSNANVWVWLGMINSSNNTISGWYFSWNSKGITLDNSSSNTFTNTKVNNNVSGMFLINSSNTNTINLFNNTNWIYLNSSSSSNTINNTQILWENNISIFNGSNNIITWWVVSSATTTTTWIVISLKSNLADKSYTVSGAWVNWIFTGTIVWNSMTGNITLTTWYWAKPIMVTYANGNIYYDTINYPDPNTPTPPSGWGGWWGWGWGWGWIASCTLSQLVCVNGKYQVMTGKTCSLWIYASKSCTVSSWTTNNWPIGSIAGSTYSKEINDAYLRAYRFGITTMPTILRANMKWELSRKHLAKMISNFAINVVGLKINTWVTCNFTDMTKESAEMKLYAKISCQLGIMGLKADGTPNTKFNPNGIVSRSQFGTVLSRLIWWDKYNGGEKYYTNHLLALQRNNIMTKIDNPSSRTELRRRVMVMLKRTFEKWFFN